MIQKTTIAIKGIEGQGKSETIKLLREILKMKF
jgi:thymidylate kinase